MNVKYRTRFCTLILMISITLAQLPAAFAQTNRANPYAALTKGQVLHGFRAEAVYLMKHT